MYLTIKVYFIFYSLSFYFVNVKFVLLIMTVFYFVHFCAFILFSNKCSFTGNGFCLFFFRDINRHKYILPAMMKEAIRNFSGLSDRLGKTL